MSFLYSRALVAACSQATCSASLLSAPLPAPVVQEYRAQLTHEPVTQDGAAIAGLITGHVAMPTPEVRAKLKLVKAAVEESQATKEKARLAEIKAMQERFEAKRAAQLKALKELEAKA